ncbi:hypothetical protein Poly51_03510 [Rubripirellula tenax]|uniref:BON domain-containing protein n=1 Tax=Rubripirellula tenax TaxID=2528015 RepID=A0A5C6FJ10_9BACT|nr:hypothetical protein [Rubripirellula tenax]TWU60077.1 hypothetical protein Poly51_03510 [Rubripirellula tenax]
MTTTEIQCRDQRMLQRIDGVLRFDSELSLHAADVQVSIESSRVVLSGSLPSASLIDQLVPAIRKAGVLNQICNNVRVA